MKIDTKKHRISPGDKVDLNRIPTHVGGKLDNGKLKHEFTQLRKRLIDLQELMYAECKHSLLVVLQAMDAGGKDSTVRKVFGPINPEGCRVYSFKSPTLLERQHDFLWRIHRNVPPDGCIAVFNRSHYEDVGIVRVKELVPKKLWKSRYEAINAFEKLLTHEGTRVVKFFLHISPEYQKKRLQRRLDLPDKHWKFNPEDLTERTRWSQYMAAYSEAIERCTSRDAPWYVIPAEHRGYRNAVIVKVLVDILEGLKMQYPKPTFDASKITIE